MKTIKPHSRYSADDSEQWRRTTEARGWLRRGYTDAQSVAGLRRRIAAKRGQAAADRLVADMRNEWSKSNERH